MCILSQLNYTHKKSLRNPDLADTLRDTLGWNPGIEKTESMSPGEPNRRWDRTCWFGGRIFFYDLWDDGPFHLA